MSDTVTVFPQSINRKSCEPAGAIIIDEQWSWRQMKPEFDANLKSELGSVSWSEMQVQVRRSHSNQGSHLLHAVSSVSVTTVIRRLSL